MQKSQKWLWLTKMRYFIRLMLMESPIPYMINLQLKKSWYTMLLLSSPNVRNYSSSQKLLKFHRAFCGKNPNLDTSEQNPKQTFSKQDTECLSRLILYYGLPGGSDIKLPNCNAAVQETYVACVGNIPWRREWLPTPLLLPGESHEQRSLADYSPWGCKESDMTE